MSDIKNMPWEVEDTDPSRGLTLRKRLTEFENTGEREGTLAYQIQVIDDQENVVFEHEISSSWEDHAHVELKFSRDGTEIRVIIDSETHTELDFAFDPPTPA